jgi:hypothetical protein
LDWDAYKRICDRPEVWSRWMLDQTAELLEPELATRLAAGRPAAALAKPAGHHGDAATDMFLLDLEPATVRAIACAVRRAIAAGISTSGTRQRGLAGFGEAWREYEQAIGRDRVAPR